MNGPEKLKNALTFKFRAADLKHDIEESLYEVRKKDFKNIAEAQNNYMKDIGSLLERKFPKHISEYTQGLVNALKELKSIDISDK